MKAVYIEDYKDHCMECCLASLCPCEGYCQCDKYREEHNPDCEGDYYFVEEREEGGEE